MHAFQDLLTAQAESLREGKIDEGAFFEALTEDRKPVRIFARSSDPETGDQEFLEVERTEDGKLRVKTQQVAAWPQITTTVGLSKEGKLQVEDVDARYVEPEAIVRPHVVKGDFIQTDVIDLNNINGTSKQDVGKQLMRDLLNVIPFPDRK